MEICNSDYCTGCFACFNICTCHAITFQLNKKGFFYPKIDSTKCVNCGRCIKVCPVNYPSTPHNYINVYAALVKDDEERSKSTSGGIFSCLAQHTLKKGGYIYGAALCKDLLVRHVEVHEICELERIRKSKYLQSEIGDCYIQAKSRLDKGSRVLFSGTPCQIAGLRKYLVRDYPNLLTIDILCHGVPSLAIYKEYIKDEEKRMGKKLIDIQFRTKKIGWKKNKTIRIFEGNIEANWNDAFVPAYLQDYFLRDSCYFCKYATDKRQGDISLGDFWEYKETEPDYIEDDDKGISLVIINTLKGKKALKSIKKEIAFTSKKMDDAKSGNPILYKPSDKPNRFSEFWQKAEVMNWGELKKEFFYEQSTKDWMNHELRRYYDIPFKKRHRKHKFRCRISKLYRGIKRMDKKD